MKQTLWLLYEPAIYLHLPCLKPSHVSPILLLSTPSWFQYPRCLTQWQEVEWILAYPPTNIHKYNPSEHDAWMPVQNKYLRVDGGLECRVSNHKLLLGCFPEARSTNEQIYMVFEWKAKHHSGQSVWTTWNSFWKIYRQSEGVEHFRYEIVLKSC